jgi:hypothetical protein
MFVLGEIALLVSCCCICRKRVAREGVDGEAGVLKNVWDFLSNESCTLHTSY